MNNEAIVINEEALRRAEDELNAFLTNVGAQYLYDGIVDSLEGRGYDLNLRNDSLRRRSYIGLMDQYGRMYTEEEKQALDDQFVSIIDKIQDIVAGKNIEEEKTVEEDNARDIDEFFNNNQFPAVPFDTFDSTLEGFLKFCDDYNIDKDLSKMALDEIKSTGKLSRETLQNLVSDKIKKIVFDTGRDEELNEEEKNALIEAFYDDLEKYAESISIKSLTETEEVKDKNVENKIKYNDDKLNYNENDLENLLYEKIKQFYDLVENYKSLEEPDEILEQVIEDSMNELLDLIIKYESTNELTDDLKAVKEDLLSLKSDSEIDENERDNRDVIDAEYSEKDNDMEQEAFKAAIMAKADVLRIHNDSKNEDDIQNLNNDLLNQLDMYEQKYGLDEQLSEIKKNALEFAVLDNENKDEKQDSKEEAKQENKEDKTIKDKNGNVLATQLNNYINNAKEKIIESAYSKKIKLPEPQFKILHKFAPRSVKMIEEAKVAYAESKNIIEAYDQVKEFTDLSYVEQKDYEDHKKAMEELEKDIVLLEDKTSVRIYHWVENKVAKVKDKFARMAKLPDKSLEFLGTKDNADHYENDDVKVKVTTKDPNFQGIIPTVPDLTDKDHVATMENLVNSEELMTDEEYAKTLSTDADVVSLGSYENDLTQKLGGLNSRISKNQSIIKRHEKQLENSENLTDNQEESIKKQLEERKKEQEKLQEKAENIKNTLDTYTKEKEEAKSKEEETETKEEVKSEEQEKPRIIKKSRKTLQREIDVLKDSIKDKDEMINVQQDTLHVLKDDVSKKQEDIDSLKQQLAVMNDLVQNISRAYNISAEDLEMLKGQTDLLSQMQDRVDEEVKGRSR